MYIKIGYTLIGGALGEAEPVAGGLVVYSEHHSAEAAQILGNGNKVFVRNVRVDSQSEANVLPMTAHVSHTCERLALGISAEAALVGKIIVVGVIPLERYLRILHNLGNPARPLLVQGVVAVHKVNGSVRPA